VHSIRYNFAPVTFVKTEIASSADLQRRFRVVAFFVVAMLWLNCLFLHDYWQGMKRGLTDFSVLYTAGTILRERLGHQLYDRQVQYHVQEAFTGHVGFRRGPLPYIHPPFEALIFWPLSWLTYRTAFLVWDAMSMVMLLGSAAIVRPCIEGLRRFALWKYMVCALAFFPVLMCLAQGQDSILLLLCCALALRAMKKRSDGFAGCWLALGSFKFQFTIPIVVLFFLWGRKRVALGFLPIAFVLALISLGISGSGFLIDYPEFAFRVVETQKLGGVPLSLLPNLHGLVVGWDGMVSRWPAIGLAVAVSILVFGFAAARGRIADVSTGEDFDLQFSLAVVVAVLVAWQTNIHDLSLLTLPLILLISYGFGEREPKRSRFDLMYPALPLLIGPLWMILWLKIGHVNLMAIPMVWWVWKLKKAMPESAGNVRVSA
jgi:hypothetical protein